MDMDPAFINVFEIHGDVIVDERDTVVMARYMWLRAGSFRAGNSTNPFAYKLDIHINGSKTDLTFVVNNKTAANKYMVVTGRLGLFGAAPATTQTRLTSKAAASATEITVESADGWVVGDELAIAPSFNNAYEFEKVTITGITGTTVSISPALNFTHYGAPTTTVTNAIGTIDMRAAVGHLTRRIRIIRGEDSTWGFRVLVTGFTDGPTVRTGSVYLIGVQFIGGGQSDTAYASLDFKDTNNGEMQSVVDSCSFAVCDSYCVKLSNNVNVTINNTVFYHARKYIAIAENQRNYNFSSNLLIGAVPRGSIIANNTSEDIACYVQFKPVNFGSDVNVVENNLCQGSKGQGFVLPYTDCDYTDNQTRFYPNAAGTTDVGFLLVGATGPCVHIKGLQAYSSEIGVIARPTTSLLRYSELMLADNGRGISLRNGYTILDNSTVIVNNTWISAVTRPTCDYCYGPTATLCNSTEALRLLVTTVPATSIQSYPTNYGKNYDSVRQAGFDSKAFLINVIFENYRQAYTSQASCSNNVVFKPNPGAIELTGSHYLNKSICNNCDTISVGDFTPTPSICGNMSCTGFSNYLIQDVSGGFLGFNGTILPNNSWIGDGEVNCTAYPTIDAHICNRTDIAVLQYESIAKDFNSRVVWPVEIYYDGGNWTSVTNAYSSWEQTELKTKRLARFISLVMLNKTYNVTFAAQPPSDMRFQLQQKTVEATQTPDWVAVYIYYPVANFISVSVNKVVIKPILSSSTVEVAD